MPIAHPSIRRTQKLKLSSRNLCVMLKVFYATILLKMVV